MSSMKARKRALPEHCLCLEVAGAQQLWEDSETPCVERVSQQQQSERALVDSISDVV